MSWGHPFYLLGLIFSVGTAWRLYNKGSRHPSGRWPQILRVSIAGQSIKPARWQDRPRPWLLLSAYSFLIVALAQPRWGAPEHVGFQESREVLIALDLSRSMLVGDVSPPRMAQAQAVVTQLLDKLEGERVGLIVFAGTAFVQVPLSSDYQIIREFIPLLKPGYIPRGGTDYTGMLEAALEGFSTDAETDRFLIVLSDGESTTEGWKEKLTTVSRRGIHILAFAVGTEQGGVVPGTELEEENLKGAPPPVISRMQPATLLALATSTGGLFQKLDAHAGVGPLLQQTIAAGRKGRYQSELRDRQPERFQWFLLAGVACAAIGLWREVTVRPRLRTLMRKSTVVPGGAIAPAAALFAILFFVPGLPAHDNGSEGGISFRATVDSSAADRLLKIVEHLARRGYDAGDVRLMVEETVNYGVEAQTKKVPVQQGAIADALAATRTGERLSPQSANWSYLRAQLRRLLVVDPDHPEKPPHAEDSKEALDEEDKPPETAGQSTQPTTSESGGRGGPSKSDAALGDFDEKVPPASERPGVPPAQVSAARTGTAPATPRRANDPIRALTLKNWREAIQQDSPGFLFQALQGNTEIKPEVDRDY